MNANEIEAANLLSVPMIKGLLDGREVDLVNIIAAKRGWRPLVAGEEMTVHFCGREYLIKRAK